MSEQLLGGRYRLGKRLGKGAMGEVFQAHDTLLGRDVAVKMLATTAMATEQKDRLLYEARAAARLNHPNIVTVYDAGDAGTGTFLVMELVDGQSLYERMPVPLQDIPAIAKQLASALAHAHRQGVIHRDLKPENVLITTAGEAKLMDFGLARSVASRVSESSGITGTVFYVAPEMALGQAVDARADLYALGVMLYELTTGELPFVAQDPLAVLSQHIHAPVVPPRSANEMISPALDHLIRDLMSKEPSARPSTAEEVLQALERLERGEPGVEDVAIAPLESIFRGQLIGRSDELAMAREQFNLVRSGSGQLVLISGEPGVGKSRLASELIAQAKLAGSMVLQGGAYEYEATTPYLPFVEALRDWVRGQSTEVLRKQLGSSAAELARLAPEIEAHLGPLQANPDLSPDQERLRLFDHLARFLHQLAGDQGLVLFIDDLHWADSGTLSLIHYLLRRSRDVPLLILGAYREVELDRTHSLSAALVAWNRERLVTRIQLSRLNLDECREMLSAMLRGGTLSEALVQSIFQETEGNPFFVEEVVKSLVEAGQVYRQGGRWLIEADENLEIPQSIKEAIGRRLNQLTMQQITVLQQAAVLGKSFRYPELAAAFVGSEAAGGVAEDRLLDVLDAGLQAQLLRSEGGETLTFTHDKIREVLYEELNPIRRRRLHQKAGEAIARLQGPAAEERSADLAYHFIHSGDLSQALPFALKAGEKAEKVFAFEEAHHYYRQAYECATALGDQSQIADTLEKIGDIQVRRGLAYEAMERYQEALQWVQDTSRRAMLKTRIGTAYGQVGDERGLSWLLEAQEDLDVEQQAEVLATNLSMIGRFHHYHAQHAEAVQSLEQALALIETRDNLFTTTQILAFLAGAYQHMALFPQSLDWARKCLAVGEENEYPLAQAIAYEFFAEDYGLIGDWTQGLKYGRRNREIGERIGSLDRLAWSGYNLAFSSFGLGDLDATRRICQESMALADQIGENRLEVWLFGQMAVVEADMGNLDEARGWAERSVAQADQLGQVALQCWGRALQAHVFGLEGSWERVVAISDEIIDLYTPTDNNLSRLTGGVPIVEGRLALGRFSEADKLLDDYCRVADASGSRHFQALGMGLQGRLFGGLEAWDRADEAFGAALEVHEKAGSRLSQAQALMQRGEIRAAGGALDGAIEDARAAAALFEACGAELHRHRAQEKLEAWRQARR